MYYLRLVISNGNMIEVKEVSSTAGLKEFIKFPDRLYKGSPYRVTPLHSVEMDALNSKINPAFDHCDAKYWIAYIDGKASGRIAGIINYTANEIRNQKLVRFGWIDFIDNHQVSEALISTVEEWGLSKGMTHLHGPLGFTDMDLEGMLIEGFNEIGTQAVLYNYPYYPEHLERLGYLKEVDWVQFEVKVPAEIPAKVERISKLVLEKYKLRILDAKKRKDLLPYANKMFQTLNESFKELYGFVPLTKRQMEYYTKQYFSIIDPRFVCFIIDQDDEVAGFGISIFSMSKALIKAKGRLFPFGFLYILNALRKNDTVDMFLQGVKLKYINKGLPSIFFTELAKAYIQNGVKIAISSHALESNKAAYLMFRDYEHRLHLKRRCFGKEILPGSGNYGK